MAIDDPCPSGCTRALQFIHKFTKARRSSHNIHQDGDLTIYISTVLDSRQERERPPLMWQKQLMMKHSCLRPSVNGVEWVLRDFLLREHVDPVSSKCFKVHLNALEVME
ncbi:hypothetical protein ANANG_G00279880 [Anguilla anguilla]|uniref:Uncharacterized protein n=1 Tax=Anguilla anguilla TaxID=7936 RepID=A0A9D3RKG8_ANGAN|nr:hypothetical protein ANANG_G00279880 [Anguilla anguilla]